MAVRALVVGSFVTDLVFRVPRWPEPDDVVIAEGHAIYRGGKGYNQAVALARLGAQVNMVGAVGADLHGQSFLSSLAAEGVDASGVVQLADEPTGVAVPLVHPNGDVAFVQYPGANAQLTPDHIADLPPADVLLLQAEVPPAVSLAAASRARARGAAVVVNPAPVDAVDAPLLEVADVLTPNRVEARTLAQRLKVDPGDDNAAALAYALTAGRRKAVITLGADGASWAEPGNHGHTAPPQVTAVDATGAGDSFTAALAVALAEGQPLPDAVAFACAAGAHAVTVPGAEPGLPTRTQVQALLPAG